MSFNPTRAENFYKRGRVRREPNPHAGVKHSEIMRRQGLGVTVPMENRVPTPHGFASSIFTCEGFEMRGELLAAGNGTSYGSNEAGDRVYVVRQGVLFVRQGFPDGKSEVRQFQAGDIFRAPRGTLYSVSASGTDGVELLVVETQNYMSGWKTVEVGLSSASLEGLMLTAASPHVDAPQVERRRDQTVAKAQAEEIATTRRRRVKATMSGPNSAGAVAERSSTRGSNDPNSGTVVGVNPRPMGARALEED